LTDWFNSQPHHFIFWFGGMCAAAFTPGQVEEYEKASVAAFKIAKELAAASDWKESKKDGDVTFFSRDFKGSSFSAIKSEIVIPKAFEEVVAHQAKYPDIPASGGVQDGTIERQVTIVKPNDFREGVVYVALESPSSLVSDRDFLTYRKHYAEGDKDYFISTSIVNDAFKGEVKKRVRAKITVQAFITEKIPGKAGSCKLSMISHADPCGSIPAWIYNSVSQKQGYVVKKTRDELLGTK
jgi:hypothetical protein